MSSDEGHGPALFAVTGEPDGLTVTTGAVDPGGEVETTIAVRPDLDRDEAGGDWPERVVTDRYSHAVTAASPRATVAFAATPESARDHVREVVDADHEGRAIEPSDGIDELFLPEGVEDVELAAVDSVRTVEAGATVPVVLRRETVLVGEQAVEEAVGEVDGVTADGTGPAGDRSGRGR